MRGSGDSPLVFTGREGCVLNAAHLARVLPWARGLCLEPLPLAEGGEYNSAAEARGVSTESKEEEV